MGAYKKLEFQVFANPSRKKELAVMKPPLNFPEERTTSFKVYLLSTTLGPA
jgi:hypothetical protein